MDIDKEKLRKVFPNLIKELESGVQRKNIHSVRSDNNVGEKAASECFSGYNPDIIDFLRRCSTEEQALEIICYLEKRKEIAADYAEKLKKQLKEKGVRSFGSKKEDDFYLKQSGYG
jgi:hypothetical protein